MKHKLLLVILLAVIAGGAVLLSSADLRAAEGDWQATYYNNSDLSGPSISREDADINFDWGLGAPIQGIGADQFSVRWQKQVVLEEGVYTFAVRSDDGSRMYVNGQRIIDEWGPRQFGWVTVDARVAEAEHTIVVEYFEGTGRAAVQAGFYPAEDPDDDVREITGGIPVANEDDDEDDEDDDDGGGSGSGGGGTSAGQRPQPTSTPRAPALPRYAAGQPGLPDAPPAAPVDLSTGQRVSVSDPKAFFWSGFPGPASAEGFRYVKAVEETDTLEARWRFVPPQNGFYAVWAYIPALEGTLTDAAYFIDSGQQSAASPVRIDQQANAGKWVRLGSYFFAADQAHEVRLGNAGQGEYAAFGDLIFLRDS